MKKKQRRNKQLNQVVQLPLNTEPPPPPLDKLLAQITKQDKDSSTSSGSAKYLFDRKYDLIDKELRQKVKENENSKKFIILNYANKYEQAGYPPRSICKRITDVLSNQEDCNASASYVRKILPEKYKDLDQMEIAKKQSVKVGATRARLQEEVARKDVKVIVEEDFNYIKPSKAKQAFKHQLAKAVWFEQENKQLSDELESLKLRLLAATWHSR